MQEKRQESAEKLARLLSGNASEQDYTAASGEEWEQAQKIWDKTAAAAETSWEPNTEKAWQRFKVKALAREQQLSPSPAAAPPAPYAESAMRWWLSAAAAVLLLLLGVWVLKYSTAEQDMVQIATAAQEKQEVLLPDGSKVWLNENSSLSYAKSFSVEDRKVCLEGEAFFEVQKAEGKRFTILAQGTVTEVIGTSFNLSAYPAAPVSVQVVSGKVAFSDTDKQEAVFLEPGQQATYAPEKGLLAKEEIKDQNFRAWQNQELQFDNTSLAELSITLSAYFNTQLVLEDGLRNCRFTAQFKNPSLQEVLKVLELTGNFTIVPVAGGYHVSGQPCR